MQALVSTNNESLDAFLEIGPYGSLRMPIHSCLRELYDRVPLPSYVSIIKKGVASTHALLETSGTCWSLGLPVSVDKLDNKYVKKAKLWLNLRPSVNGLHELRSFGVSTHSRHLHNVPPFP